MLRGKHIMLQLFAPLLIDDTIARPLRPMLSLKLLTSLEQNMLSIKANSFSMHPYNTPNLPEICGTKCLRSHRRPR